ncbi:hypothetical protein Tco_0389722 [Tanacetum coccineum]
MSDRTILCIIEDSTSHTIIDNKIVDGKPWFVGGYMNIILNTNEHFAGISFVNSEMQEFKDCVNMIEVEDLCSSGLFFTCTKNLKKAREGNHTCVLKKLDRVMIDKDPYNKDLRDTEVATLKEYATAMEDEEKLLFQKSKIKWLSLGDRNNAFFHKTLKGRYQRNIIEKIQDVNGINHGGQDVAEQFVIHFQRFLDQKGDVREISKCRSLLYNKISNEEACSMVCDVSSKEIKDALFDIGDNKALGRQIQDNILLTQELLKGYDRKGGPSRVAFKIDIQKAYDTVNWNVKRNPKFQYYYGCKNIKITHVCFADDLLVLCHGDADSVKVVSETIDEFGECSGLLPNFNKNTIFFGSKKDEIQEEIMKFIPFEKGKLPMKYLGVPLITKRLGIKNCKCLVDRVRDRISN